MAVPRAVLQSVQVTPPGLSHRGTVLLWLWSGTCVYSLSVWLDPVELGDNRDAPGCAPALENSLMVLIQCDHFLHAALCVKLGCVSSVILSCN
jgi:hypothetical protein